MKPKIVTGIALISCIGAGSVLWFASREATGVSKSPVVAERPAAPLPKAESAPRRAGVAGRRDRARQTPGAHVGLPRLSHAVQGRPERSRTRHGAPALGSPGFAEKCRRAAALGAVARLGGGDQHRLVRPWGVSFTANLTSDKETGIGSWTKQNFIQTIRTGRHLGRGRQILPPMPVPVYQNFSDEERGRYFLYLQTIPAIRNRVPAPLPRSRPKTKRGKSGRRSRVGAPPR